MLMSWFVWPHAYPERPIGGEHTAKVACQTVIKALKYRARWEHRQVEGGGECVLLQMTDHHKEDLNYILKEIQTD